MVDYRSLSAGEGRTLVKKGDKKKRRKALEKRTRRKQANRQVRATGVTSVLGHIRQARSYPIEGCWVGEGWDEGGIAVIVVARRQPNGNIVFGNYLVDCYCLGLKDTFFNADVPASLFQRDYMAKIFSEMSPVDISPALAHEIVYGSIEYAAQFGFRPHRDFRRSQLVLDLPDLHPRTGTVEFGRDGQPFFIAGPYDNVQAILRQLDRTAGEGNYHYVMQVSGLPADVWDE
jgi:hypothetical protein